MDGNQREIVCCSCKRISSCFANFSVLLVCLVMTSKMMGKKNVNQRHGETVSDYSVHSEAASFKSALIV